MDNTARILASIAKNPDAPNHRIAKNLGIRVSEVEKLRTESPAPVSTSKGTKLTGLRVLPRKPADSAAMLIKQLPSNEGFEIPVLAHSWGISEETIRRHAKDLKCHRYVEINGEWIPMVMNPETAGRYSL